MTQFILSNVRTCFLLQISLFNVSCWTYDLYNGDICYEEEEKEEEDDGNDCDTIRLPLCRMCYIHSFSHSLTHRFHFPLEIIVMTKTFHILSKSSFGFLPVSILFCFCITIIISVTFFWEFTINWHGISIYYPLTQWAQSYFLSFDLISVTQF